MQIVPAIEEQLLERVILTLYALWVLKEKYEDKEDEWQMIARKAKGFLKANGISKVEALLKKLSYY